MQAFSLYASTSSLLAALLVMAAGFTSTGASANVPPELAKGMVQGSANLNYAAVACGEMSAQKVESLREAQRAELLKTLSTMPAAEYDRLYADASTAFQAKWASLTAAQKQQTCTAMKKYSTPAK